MLRIVSKFITRRYTAGEVYLWYGHVQKIIIRVSEEKLDL